MSFDLLEIFDFLDNSNAEVRKLACSHVAGVSDDATFIDALAGKPELLTKLVALIHDADLSVEHDAWRALVNLAKDRTISAALAESFGLLAGVYICLCAGIKFENEEKPFMGLVEKFSGEQLIFPDLACMLLSNMTKNMPAYAESLSPLTGYFMEILISGREKFDFLFSVLANMTLSAECRLILTSGSSPAFLRLLSFVYDKSMIKRGGVCVITKNCLLETYRHESILLESDDTLLAALLGRIVDAECCFSDEELDEMLLEISLEHRNSPAEVDPAIREMILESLLILGSTLRCRQLMREKGVYPVVREWHKRETEANLHGLLEQIVEYIIRDEDPQVLGIKNRPIKSVKTEAEPVEEAEDATPVESLI